MKTKFPSHPMARREFIAAGTGLAATVALGSLPVASAAPAAEAPSRGKSIGIQVGAVSFVDEGTEEVLDLFQERGAIDTIYLTTFTYGRAWPAGRSRGTRSRTTARLQSDEKTFHGGNYAMPHAEFYRDTVLKQTRAPDHGGVDIVATVLPAAGNAACVYFVRSKTCFAPTCRASTRSPKSIFKAAEPEPFACAIPACARFWTGLATDLCKSYDVDGILFFNERNGPLLNALGASHAQSMASSRVTCFCEHHQRAAKERGIDFRRARQGYQELDQFIQAALKGQRPSDGYFVESGACSSSAGDRRLGSHVRRNEAPSPREVNAAVKRVRPGLLVGFHIEHVNSFNPIFPRHAHLRGSRRASRLPPRWWSITTAAANATPTSFAMSARPCSATCPKMHSSVLIITCELRRRGEAG